MGNDSNWCGKKVKTFFRTFVLGFPTRKRMLGRKVSFQVEYFIVFIVCLKCEVVTENQPFLQKKNL